MNFRKYFTLVVLSCVAITVSAQEATKKDPIPDKLKAEWWKVVAAEISMAKQYSDAQTAMKTLPDLFVKNGEKKKSLEADMTKACESAKEEFAVDQQNGDPTCAPKQVSAKLPAKSESAPKVESKPAKN